MMNIPVQRLKIDLHSIEYISASPLLLHQDRFNGCFLRLYVRAGYVYEGNSLGLVKNGGKLGKLCTFQDLKKNRDLFPRINLWSVLDFIC